MSFDLTAPLPLQPVLLEASAGTGKTYTLAALATRYLAEGIITVDELACITFTRRAAGELRHRLFRRFSEAHRALVDHSPAGASPHDPVLAHLVQQDVPERAERLRVALENFDRAMVGTIHDFCATMLRRLGVLGDWDEGQELVGDARALAQEVGTDLYLARYQDGTPVPWRPYAAARVSQEICLRPMPLLADTHEQRDFAAAVRQRFRDRKRALGLVSFDDLVTRLAELLEHDPDRLVRDELQRLVGVLMVDEFQDTDPHQWRLLRLAFVDDQRPVVLIGDPKQSIYGFRSADLSCYRDAADRMGKITLTTNYRSDQAVVDGVEELFGNLPLGDPDVTITPVTARHQSRRLTLPGSDARVQVRVVPRNEAQRDTVADDLVDLLHRLHDQARVSEESTERGLRWDDVAVLVRTRQRGQKLAEQLERAGIPVVFSGGASVLSSRAADEWDALLAAIESPGRAEALAAGLTDLLGFDLESLLGQDGDAGGAAPAALKVAQLRASYEEAGIPGVLTALEADGWGQRLAALPHGARRLVDLQHVGELLATAPVTSVHELRRWLAEQRSGAADDLGAQLRMSSDGEAVRVLTMHAAKGLEFGVVLIPQTEQTGAGWQPTSTLSHEGRRHLHIGKQSNRVRDQRDRDDRDEEFRLLYVGLTRAKYLAVLWQEAGDRPSRSALSALLGRDRSTTALNLTHDPRPTVHLDPGLVQVTTVDGAPAPPASHSLPTPDAPRELGRFTRTLDATWRRTSYTGLTSGLPHGAMDEPSLDGDETLTATGGGMASPMNGLPGGTGFGTLVHAVLEQLDWSRPTLLSQAERVVGELAPRHGLAPELQPQLAAAVVALCTTPLAALGEGRALADFPVAERLPELDFDLPLGNRASPVALREVAAAMVHHLPSDDPLASYPQHLLASDAAGAALNGFLTGSIDAVLRTPSGRFLVVDYKTNTLPTAPGEELTVQHYSPATMARAMIRSHYPLQALLYSAALHRYLSWRLPGYRPEEHLGGAGYLFVRGMAGPDTPVIDGHPCGVFSWYPPADLVVETSELLGGRDGA